MTSEGTSNLKDEAQPSRKDDRHEELMAKTMHKIAQDVQDSPRKLFTNSVPDVLTQAVQAIVSGKIETPTPSDESEEKTFMQTVREKIIRTAQTVKGVVTGSSTDNSDADIVEKAEEKFFHEKFLRESVQEQIDETTPSVKDTVIGGNLENDDVEEKSEDQATLGEKIVQLSAETVKDTDVP